MSYSPLCRLSDLLMALDTYAEQQLVDHVYFWISFFSLDLHSLPEQQEVSAATT